MDARTLYTAEPLNPSLARPAMVTTGLFQRAAARLGSSSKLFFNTSKHIFSTRSTLPGSRFSCISRLPLELSCVGSMMPLHDAIASSRLRSILAPESQSWGLIPQGLAMPL